MNSVWLPALEGDGSLTQDDAPMRLRVMIVQRIMGLLSADEESAVLITWNVVGIIYIIGALFFVMSSTDRFWTRLMGLAFFACYPSVVNFLGYYDSYGVTYTSTSAFLACLYLASRRRHKLFLVVSAIAFFFSMKAHHQFYVMMIYPAFGIIIWTISKFNTKTYIRCIFIIAAILIMILIALYYFGEIGDPILSPHPKARLIRNAEGLLAALFNPINLILSFSFPYVFLVVVLIFYKKGRMCITNSLITETALWASLSIFFVYYIIQLLYVIANLGILDFVCQAGCVGALFVVPMFVIIKSCLEKYLYCFVIICIFITIPNLVVHHKPVIAARLINCLEGERGSSYQIWSPYLMIGRIFKNASENDSKLIPFVYEIFERGANNTGYYRKFASLNLFQLIQTQYEHGHIEASSKNIERFLRQRPRMCAFLVLAPPKFVDLVAPPKIVDDHTLKAIILDTRISAQQFYEKTGNPIYAEISRICDARAQYGKFQHCPKKSRAAVRSLLDYYDNPESEKPAIRTITVAKEVLSKMGLEALIQDSHVSEKMESYEERQRLPVRP